MVNTINTLTERNKELKQKVEELESKNNSFPSREQQLKVLDEITQRDISSSVDFLKYLGASETEINLFTESITTTIRVSCGVPYDFRDRENPLKDYFANFVMRFSGAFEKKARLEKEVENLKTQKEEKEAELKEQKEAFEKEIKALEKELKEAWSEGDTHIEAMQYVGELVASEKGNLTKKIGVLENAGKEILVLLTKTQKEVKELKEFLANSQKEVGELKKMKEEKEEFQSHLNNKPLPKLPSKLKIFKGKVKNKFQQLVKRKSLHQEQKLVAKIEVPVK